MTKTPLVSVIIPTFNRQNWLPVSIESVRAQTFTDWELIIVDDHSTDQTEAVVQDYVAQDSRIHYAVNGRRKGPAGARNHGIALARGRYVAFLDSDDEWVPFHLRDMVHYLTEYPDRIDLITASAERKNQVTGETYQQSTLDLSELRGDHLEDAFVFDPQALFDMSFQQSLITTQTMVMKRDLLTETQFDEDLPPGPEDRFFHLEIAYRQRRVAYLPGCHVTYWAHGDNLTCCGSLRHPSENVALFLAYEQIEQRCLEKFELNEQRRRRIRQSLARMCFWQIGYNGYLANGQFQLAREYFLKGIRLDPYRFSYWKTWAVSFVHQLFPRSSSSPVRVSSNGSKSAAE